MADKFETKLIRNYKKKEGTFSLEASSLIKEGYGIYNIADYMRFRIAAIRIKNEFSIDNPNFNDKEVNFFVDHKFDTLDGLIDYEDNLFLDHNSKFLAEINKDSKFDDMGNLILDYERFYDEIFNNKSYKKFNKREIIEDNKKQSSHHSRHWAKGDQLAIELIKLSGYSKEILDEYVDAILSEMEWRDKSYNEMFKWQIQIDRKSMPVITNLTIMHLDQGSNFVADGGLNGEGFRLIGYNLSKVML